MPTTPTTWTGAAALAAFVAASAGCSLIVGNDDRAYVAPDAADDVGAAAADAATSSDGPTVVTRDAGPQADAPTAPNDAAPPPPVDASPPPPPVDASPPPPACPPPGAPPGTACCGSVACIGQACQHCNDCSMVGCARGEYCCADVNGGGHYKGVSCSATPSCMNGGMGNGNGG